MRLTETEKQIQIHRLEGRAKEGYAVWGGIWPRGEVKENSFLLKSSEGKETPMQSRITAFWPDGSVKWSAHCADSSLMNEEMLLETGCPEPMKGMELVSEPDSIRIHSERVRVVVPRNGDRLLQGLYVDGKKTADMARSVLILEKRKEEKGTLLRREVPFYGQTTEVTVEEQGPLKCVLRIAGVHRSAQGDEKIPFLFYMTVYEGIPDVRFTGTYFYDGDEKQDFLKGMGVCFTMPVEGAVYNRHVKIAADYGYFHESSALMYSVHPRIPQEIYLSQLHGEELEETPDIRQVCNQIPMWDEYRLLQSSSRSFLIRKKQAGKEFCSLDCLEGSRAGGVMAAGGDRGGLMISCKNFWQKFPSGLWVRGLTGESAQMYLWFWSPEAEAMDFSHYADRGYSQSYYEGFDDVRATAYGTAVTSEFAVRGYQGMIPEDEELDRFGFSVQKPPVYLASPEYYHQCRAFGFFSLPDASTPVKVFLEDQMRKAADFYLEEREQRGWYGLYNYGDFMHNYDSVRHRWRYDMGGYAWQNTELVPTLWLWYAFLRGQREEVFELAEAMSRHCAEVDVYHFGPYQGLGSRHNVRHWGCPCKEVRISMAGHHRFYYYLTGDPRTGEVMGEVKDADLGMEKLDPLRFMYDRKEMVYPTHARSGPDWSSLCSDWMTQWERFQDEQYREKIERGIASLKKAPFRLISGSVFEYNSRDNDLRYIGEDSLGGSHMVVCFGAPSIWLELTELLEDEEWKEMLAELGRFFFMDREEQLEYTCQRYQGRTGRLLMMAAGLGAYAAQYYQDHKLAQKVWKTLLGALIQEGEAEGFTYVETSEAGNQKLLKEIPWISTNFASQWCLNTIMALEFIGDELPVSMEKVNELLSYAGGKEFRQA